MTEELCKYKSGWVLVPVWGILLFVALYILATINYPGGSHVDKDAIGFSWANNYWCNLLNETAINGELNRSRPIAMTGMIVLGLTLIFFWVLFPAYIDTGKSIKTMIRISGILSMIISFFLFTNLNHDLVTNLASFFGFIATVGVLIGLYKEKWYPLFAFGILNMVLVGVNNYVYYNKELVDHLPVIQKISFMTFLTWICVIDLGLYRMTKFRKAI